MNNVKYVDLGDNTLEIINLQSSMSESKRFMIVDNGTQLVKSFCSTDKLFAKATYGEKELLGVDDDVCVVYISSLNTIRQFQNKGYAAMVLAEVKKYYKNDFLYLYVRGDGPLTNEQLVAFYGKMGFNYVGLYHNNPCMVCDLRNK